MKLLACAIVLLSTTAALAQRSSYNLNAGKPGSCPPALPVEQCEQACYSDSHCYRDEKCCRTNCGGTVCSKPVTMSTNREKPGVCPEKPTGRWVCSSTCTYDSDCRSSLKCCANRCGALACMKPEIEVEESVELPVIPLESRTVETYNRNPYYNRLPPPNYPYYVYYN